MATVTNTSLAAVGQIIPTSILLQTSGDILTYTASLNQILVLHNSDTISATVTLDGASGSTVILPDTGGTTASVASGKAYTIAAGATTVIKLPTIASYLQGVVSISAAVADKVYALCLY